MLYYANDSMKAYEFHTDIWLRLICNSDALITEPGATVNTIKTNVKLIDIHKV